MAKTKLPHKRLYSQKGDIAQVDWLDAHSKHGWWGKGDTKWDGRGFPVTMGATVVEENDKGITLTMGIADDGQAAGAFFIPRGMIQKVRVVQKAKKIIPCWQQPYGKKQK